MQSETGTPTRLERIAAVSVEMLQRAGLGRLAYSESMRRLGKQILLREDRAPGVRTIATGMGKGLKLLVLPETPKSYWLGTHEPDMQAMLQQWIKPGMTVYDCGANIGYFSVILADLIGPTGKLYAFEPSPSSLECLRASVSINDCSNVTVVPKAVWRSSETLRFARGPQDKSLVSDHVEGVFREPSAPGGYVEIAAISLDEFVYRDGNEPPAFIKMDVEGSEGEAIEGARRLLADHRPSLLLEIHGEPGRVVWECLRDLNYVSRNIATGEVPRTADEFAVWIRQYLAIPLEQTARS